MNHQFTLKVDPIVQTGSILLDGQAIFPQSQLQICTMQSFFDWYRDLPALMFAEINDDYSISVECLDIQYALLCQVFSGIKECREIKYTPVNVHYTTEQRFGWLTEAAAKMNAVLPQVPSFSIQAACAGGIDISSVVATLPAFYSGYYTKSMSRVNLWLATPDGLGAISSQSMTANDLVLCDGASPALQVPVLSRSRSGWSAAIVTWVDQMILLPYLLHCQELLLNPKNASTFDVKARLLMLSRDEPYVELTLPSRMEIGTTCPLAIEKFPQSDLSLHISHAELLAPDQNNQLLARKTGRVNVTILSKTDSVLWEQTVEIYQVNRVNAISLVSRQGNSILVGNHLTVVADCRPKGAENLSKAVWSVSPANVLKNIGGGQFAAEQPGTCTVTLTVEKVSQSIQITVIPLAADIHLPSEVRVKVKGKPYGVHASLLPKGSACTEIRCRTSDGRIAQWDAGAKTVIPVSEGNTNLEVAGIGPNGNILFRKSCPVVVLPEKLVFTPPTMLTLAICCAIIALLISHTPFVYTPLLTSLILFFVSGVVNAIPWLKHKGTLGNKAQTIVSAIGFVLSILMFLLVVL